MSSLNAKVQTLNTLPRYFLEFMSIFGIVVFLFFMVSLNQPLSDLISILGLMIAALLKSSSVNKILSSLQNIKYYSSSVNSIKNSLEEEDSIKQLSNSTDHFDFKNDLIIKNVYFKYESSESFVLEDLNLKIKPNMSIGIIGPSGSGKSTFVDLLVGLLKPSRGKKIGTKDIHRNITLWKFLGYVSQEIFLTDRSILENIYFDLKTSR